MDTQPDFPQFTALPVHNIRNYIWQRAAQRIISTPSFRFVDISRQEPDLEHEARLASEAALVVSQAAEADPNYAGDGRSLADKQTEAIRAAIRKYRATLVTIMPDRRVTWRAAGWSLNDIAGTCTEAYMGVKDLLKVLGKRLDEKGLTACFDLVNDVVCLAGPEMAPISYPFFHNDHAVEWNPQDGTSTASLDRQVVIVGPEEEEDRWSDFYTYRTMYPTLPQICPDLATLRRVAFVYTDNLLSKVAPDLEGLDLGFEAVWPKMMPNLKEVYLLHETFPLKDGNEQQQRQFLEASTAPSIPGALGTFYEVHTAEVMKPVPSQPLPFRVAWLLQRKYGWQGVEVWQTTGVPMSGCVTVKICVLVMTVSR